MKCPVCHKQVRDNECDCTQDYHDMYWDWIYDDHEYDWGMAKRRREEAEKEWDAWDDWKEKKKRIDKINEALGEGKNTLGDFMEKKNK